MLVAEPAGVQLTRRAAQAIEGIRAQRSIHVRDGKLLVSRDERGDWRWWTFAGARANRTLAAWAEQIVVARQRIGSESIRLHGNLTVDAIREGLAAARGLSEPLPQPHVNEQAVQGLKFSAALPESLAVKTLLARIGDPDSARTVMDEECSYALEG